MCLSATISATFGPGLEYILLFQYFVISYSKAGVGKLFGVEGRMSPKELAAGRTGDLREKFNNCGLAHPPHHEFMMSCHICKSTERKRGDLWYFVQDCFKINSTSFQLYTIFPTSPKIPNFTRLVTEGSSVKGVSQRQRVSREPISIDYQCATKSRSA